MERRSPAQAVCRWGLVGALLSGCGAAGAGEQSLSVINQATREVKRYEFGATAFSVDVSFVPGWSHCQGRPVKNFTFSGIDTKRVELWCNTRAGAAVAFSCVATRTSPSVTVQQLYAEGYKYVAAEDRVETRGAVELALSCSAD